MTTALMMITTVALPRNQHHPNANNASGNTHQPAILQAAQQAATDHQAVPALLPIPIPAVPDLIHRHPIRDLHRHRREALLLKRNLPLQKRRRRPKNPGNADLKDTRHVRI